jgi:hypothetical protein
MLVRGELGMVAFIALFFTDVTAGTAVAISSIHIHIPMIFVLMFFLLHLFYRFFTSDCLESRSGRIMEVY